MESKELDINRVRAVLVDLDGTLLDMDQEVFTREYFKTISAFAGRFGYDPRLFANGLKAGLAAMIRNDGLRTNREAFLKALEDTAGLSFPDIDEMFAPYYTNGFERLKSLCHPMPDAVRFIHFLHQRGIRVLFASNPVFPIQAMKTRIAWAGLNLKDFEGVEGYETACFAKPNPKFFETAAEKAGLPPEACLMVGNDPDEDCAAVACGMQVYLVADEKRCPEKKAEPFAHGSLAHLMDLLERETSKEAK